uniref:Uncharacterized protein n=1 Tax=Arundo donax TaxID=35708 RepID=A0A0A8Y852_ARUDO
MHNIIQVSTFMLRCFYIVTHLFHDCCLDDD